MGEWYVVIPPTADQTNLVTNPSAELVVTGYTGATNTPARQATYQRRGAWGVSYAMAAGTTDGLYWGTVSLTSGTTYTFSCDVRGALGIPYRIYFGSTAAAVKGTPTTFTGTGDWQRVTVSWAADSTTTFRLYVGKNTSADTSTIYVDGFQCVAASSDQVYFDGDSRGFRDSDFYWTGTAHSSTSVMRAGTRAGGTVVDLESYGFYVRQFIGLGLAGLANIITPTPLIGGGVYQRTITEPRQFALAGWVQGTSYQNIQNNRRSLINAFKPDAAPVQQPALLRYQASTFGDVLDIPAIYEGGLEGGENVPWHEQTALKFSAYMPYVAVEDGSEGVSLGYQTSLASINYIVQRSAAGAWSLMGTGVSGGTTVYALAVGPDGTVYAGGAFTGMNSVANTAYIAKWSGSAWTALGTGANGTVYALAVGPDGTLYAGGAFTSMGGVASTAYIAKWNGSAWSALGTGAAGGEVRNIVVGLDGTVYAGGLFTSMGGVANTDSVAKWSGSAWAAMGTGAAGGDVYSMAVGTDGAVYAGGTFTSMGGVSNTARVAKWSSSAWAAMGTGASTGNVRAMSVGLDGTVYVGGTFTDMGGATNTNGIARWTGSAWGAVGTGNGDPFTLIALPDGRTYAAGTFTSMGGVPNTLRNAIWNGSTWMPTGFQFPGSYTVWSYAAGKDRVEYYGINTSGTATLESVTTATNNGMAIAYPSLRMTGPGTVYQIQNITTGDTIYFNLTLNSGEVAILDLTPGAIKFYSNFRANLLNTILPGSNLATFRLMPGANSISLFVAGTTDANTAAWMYWRKPHHSIDGGSN